MQEGPQQHAGETPAGLGPLRKMQYPGRGIIVGRVNTASGTRDVVAYFLTGRSPSSKARKLVFKKAEQRVWVEATEKKTVDDFKYRELLLYPAISLQGGCIAVSNGEHTSSVEANWDAPDHKVALVKAHASWSFEPDAPIYTPRISAFLRGKSAALGIIRRKHNGSAEKEFFRMKLEPGKFDALTTYAGKNEKLVPSFKGPPLGLKFDGSTPSEIADELYSALPPDFRVAVAVVFHDPVKGGYDVEVRNRHELEGHSFANFPSLIGRHFRALRQNVKYKGLLPQGK